MKIGIDVSRAIDDKKTGVGWYAFFVVQALKHLSTQAPKHSSTGALEHDEKIEFILYTHKPLTGELAELPEGWKVKILHWAPKRLWTQIRLSWEMLWHAPDILFVPAHVFPIIHPKKTVMTVHDIAATRFSESYNWFERWYSVWSAKFAVKHLWKVIVPSEFTKKELLKWEMGNGKLGDNVHVVHHGYDKAYHKIEDKNKIEEVLKKYGLEKPFFMTIGRLEHKKNTVGIIEAFERLKSKSPITDHQLLLVGKPGYGYEEVRAKINNSKFKNDIITPGWVDAEDIPVLMNTTDVFVFPSLYEGFGIPILEAMACGTPVVASSGSSLDEVGGDAITGVNPMDSADIAYAIQNILNNDEYRKEQIGKGLERVKEFSWGKCGEETMKILLEK